MEKGSLNNGSDVLGRIIKYCRCAVLHDLCYIKVCISDPAKIHLYFLIVVRQLKAAYSSKLYHKIASIADIVDESVSWQSMEESVAANSLTVTETTYDQMFNIFSFSTEAGFIMMLLCKILALFSTQNVVRIFSRATLSR